MNEAEVVKRQLQVWGLNLDEPALESLVMYAARLGNYREANVVGTRDLSRLLLEHVLDSLSCLLYKQVRGAETLIDVGAGGGLPGIPLKIVRSGLNLTLLEATGKKTRFLEQELEGLRLGNIEVVNDRAEAVGHESAYRERYDVATARAVATLSTLSEYCLPLVKKGGCMVAMKARLDRGEIEAGQKSAKMLGAEIAELIEVKFLPEVPAKQRHLVVMAKVSETPSEYPRRVGVPKKSPLGSS